MENQNRKITVIIVGAATLTVAVWLLITSGFLGLFLDSDAEHAVPNSKTSLGAFGIVAR